MWLRLRHQRASVPRCYTDTCRVQMWELGDCWIFGAGRKVDYGDEAVDKQLCECSAGIW